VRHTVSDQGIINSWGHSIVTQHIYYI